MIPIPNTAVEFNGREYVLETIRGNLVIHSVSKSGRLFPVAYLFRGHSDPRENAACPDPVFKRFIRAIENMNGFILPRMT